MTILGKIEKISTVQDSAVSFNSLEQGRIGRCGGSLLAHQTSEAEVLGSNPESPTMILMRCRIIVK